MAPGTGARLVQPDLTASFTTRLPTDTYLFP